MLLLIAAAVVSWVLAIRSINRTLPEMSATRLLWLILVVVAPIIGPLLWFSSRTSIRTEQR